MRVGNGLTVPDVLPPSIHPDTGKPYAWKGDWRSLPELPPTLLALWRGLERTPPKSDKKPFDRKSVLDGVPEGERDDKLFRYAYSLKARGVDLPEAQVLIVCAADNAKPPFPRDEALKKVARAYEQYGNDAEADQTTDRRTLADLDLESMRLVNLKWDIEESVGSS